MNQNRSRWARAVLTVAAGGLWCSTVDAQWTLRQPGYVLESVAGGPAAAGAASLQLPVAIAFVRAPGTAVNSPLFYVAERYGTVKLVRRDGTTSVYASGLTNLGPGPIPGAGELGIGGMAVDPATGDVLVTAAYDPTPPSGTVFSRVVRLTSTDGGLTASGQSVLLDLPIAVSGNAQALGVNVGIDGKVYVLVGDGGVSADAQDVGSFRGKVLRVNADGSAPSDNPLYSVADGISATDYVFARGFRRPTAGAWRALDGTMYVLDQGPLVTDRLVRLVRDRNYLYDGLDTSLVNFAMYNWAPAAAPAPQIAAAPAGMAFVQFESFAGSGYPATGFGRAYIAETGPAWGLGPQTMGKRLGQVFIDGTGVSAAAPVTLAEYTGSGRGTCAAVAAGPDGVYFSDLYKDTGAASATEPGASIWRVRYVGTAAFTASPTFVDGAPVTVQFGDASVVPGATSWLWSFGDGGTSVQRNPQHTYQANGSYTVRLTVTGSAGPVVSERTNFIRVGQPPRIAVIGGALPATLSDLNLANYLRGLGWDVVSMDDEPANRPGSGQIAQEYQLALISSTVTSGNIGSEFTSAQVPMIFWEGSLLRTTREALASNGATASGQTQIEVTDNTHWITRNLAIGNLGVYPTGRNMSLAADTLAPSARVLATRVGQPTQPAIMTAEAQTVLLNNYVTPARRVFLFYENDTFQFGTAAARTILGDSACWAMRLSPEIFTQPQGGNTLPGQTRVLSATVGGGRPRTFQWKKDGANVVDGGRISGATTEALTITNAQSADAGSYTLVFTVPCGTVTSAAAAVTVNPPCAADFDGSGTLGVQDIFDYLAAYFSGDLRADINGGGLSVQDIFDYLGLYFAGCA